VEVTRKRAYRGSGSGLIWALPVAAAVVLAVGIGHSEPIGWTVLALVIVGALALTLPAIGDAAILTWVVLEVVAYPFVRAPQTQTILTFDRVWIMGLVGVLFVVPRRFPASRATRFVWVSFAVFVAAFGVRAFLTRTPDLSPQVTWFDAILLPFILFLVGRRLLGTVESRVRLAGAFAISGTVLGAVGIWERISGSELASLSGGLPRVDFQLGVIRISGTYNVPEVFALNLLICLGMTCYWLQVRGRNARLLGSVAVAVQAAAIGLSLFRAAWVGVLVIVIASFGFRPKRGMRALVTVGLVGLAGLFVIVPLEHTQAGATRLNDTANVDTRFATYLVGYHLFRQAPLFGVGVDQFPSFAPTAGQERFHGIANQIYPHSSYVAVLAEDGLLGFIPFLLLNVAIVRLIRTTRRSARSHEEDVFGATLLGISVAFFLMSIGLTMLPYEPSNAFFAVVLGAAASLVDGRHVTPRRSGEPGVERVPVAPQPVR